MSFLDTFSGYHQIKMDPEDSKKTSFITTDGLFCYNIIPFELKNVGAIYQRLKDKFFCLQKERNLEVYVDDLLVKSRSLEQHILDLIETFETMQKYNIRLNLLKSTFGATSGKFLGFLLSFEKIKINPDKTRAILEIALPTSPKKVQRLIGRIAGLSRFISRSDEKCLYFFKVLRSAKRFKWTEDWKNVFQQLKGFLSSPPLH